MYFLEAAFRRGVSVFAVVSLSAVWWASKLMQYDLISLKELFCVIVLPSQPSCWSWGSVVNIESMLPEP